jgi:putative transposase
MSLTETIKIEIKKCEELDYKQLNPILHKISIQTCKASNKAMRLLYLKKLNDLDYKELYQTNIDVKSLCGKSFDAHLDDNMKVIMNICNTGNVSQTRRFVTGRFNDDVKRNKILQHKISLAGYRENMPVIIHNENYIITQGEKDYQIKCSLFNNGYKKENNIDRLTFHSSSLNSHQKTTLNRIINGEYQQGFGQIVQDKKGKWYFHMSFKFEPQVHELDPNRVLGVDLGIVNAATLQIWDNKKEDWDLLSWKECVLSGSEIIHFRQKHRERIKGLQILRKVSNSTNRYSEGKKGHGTQTKLKPLQNLYGKEVSFRDTLNHKYSKYIIDFAIKNNCGIIQLENLSGFNQETKSKFLKNWTYYDFDNKIIYKAKRYGITVNFVNPSYTSLRCSKCGCIDIENRDCKNNQAKFKCVTCGFEINADINGARNIALPNIESIIEDQCEVNGLKLRKTESQKLKNKQKSKEEILEQYIS